MADNQPLNATFFAFKKRERGGVLLGATIAYVAISIVLGGLFVWLNWQAVVDYFNWTMSMSRDAAKVDPNDPFAGKMPPQSVMSLGAWYFLFLIVFYLLLAAYEAACLRWMIRGETKGLFGLALDGDTWRVYFTYWIWFFLLMAVYVVAGIVAVGTIAGAAIGAQGNPESLGAMGPVVLLLVLAIMIALIYFGVRFAPAAATSVAKRRFAFFDAWAVTKGRFWALLGSFVLLWLMYFVGVVILSFVATFAMGAGMMGQIQTGAEPATPEEALAMFASPSVWIPLAICYGLMIIGAFVFYVALFGVNARAAQAALEEGKITASAAS
ncbi:MAG: hypothetical protein ACT4OF_01235 [Caulobacteraceae bacterium]